MTLIDLMSIWPDLSYQKKRQALQRVVDFIDYEDKGEDLLRELISTAEDFEHEDYFGTEGLNV